MPTETAVERFATLPERLPSDQYNFDHFRTKHLVQDVVYTIESHGLQPGELAPDFELPSTDGRTIRLSELRGHPVLLHFGSYT